MTGHVGALVDGAAAAHYFGVPPSTIRKWVQRYAIAARGTDARGRRLYALTDFLDRTPGGHQPPQ